MKKKFNHIAVHKNITRERELRKVTLQGSLKLSEALKLAKLQSEHRQALLRGGKDE